MAITLNALAGVENINNIVQLAKTYNKTTGLEEDTKNLIRPEVFYSKIVLDTIRIDKEEFKYYKLADETPIQDKAEKLVLRRWAPLQAHTVPLMEGVPPKSDKGSVEKYELSADQYGRYMEFTDKVDFSVVDPIIAHYTREYSIVAMETLDMLARETLLAHANPWYANQAADFESLTFDSKPNMTDLRLIVLHFKRALVKPRGGKYKVIVSPEFTFDMINDPTVEKYMKINQTTKNAYDGSVLFPLFGMEFEETLVCPSSGDFMDGSTESKRIYRVVTEDEESYDATKPTYQFMTITKETEGAYTDYTDPTDPTAGAYIKDPRTGMDASFIPQYGVWNIEGVAYGDDNFDDWHEFNVQHILIVGKDALTRTCLTGEGQVKVYAKPKGSAGVLDPIDQRQSIGFKINSVGFGSTRPEAIVDYMCVPTTANLY